MTETILINEIDNDDARKSFDCSIRVDSKNEARICAKVLREMAKDDRLDSFRGWAESLADIFEGK